MLTLLRLAERLAISLEGGLLAGRGPIDLGDGLLADPERAARIVLADVEALIATVDDGPIVRAQHWESVERQLERLSSLGNGATPPGTVMPSRVTTERRS